MATTGQNFGTDIVDIKTDLSLAEGSDYVFQNTGATHVFIHEGAAEPTRESFAIDLSPGERLPFQIGSEGVYAWAETPAGQLTVIDGT